MYVKQLVIKFVTNGLSNRNNGIRFANLSTIIKKKGGDGLRFVVRCVISLWVLFSRALG
jgi:hypothetical protein